MQGKGRKATKKKAKKKEKKPARPAINVPGLAGARRRHRVAEEADWLAPREWYGG